MGRTPESFFRRAVKGAPASQGDSQECAFPESSKLIKTVKACRQSCAAGAECPQIASRRCCARRPEPPARGNPRSARTTSWLSVVKLLGISLSKEGRLLEGWRFNSSAQARSSEKAAVPRDSSARIPTLAGPT